MQLNTSSKLWKKSLYANRSERRKTLHSEAIPEDQELLAGIHSIHADSLYLSLTLCLDAGNKKSKSMVVNFTSLLCHEHKKIPQLNLLTRISK